MSKLFLGEGGGRVGGVGGQKVKISNESSLMSWAQANERKTFMTWVEMSF